MSKEQLDGALANKHALVTGAVCAEVAREIGADAHLRLGKQARDDGAAQSDNVLGDVVEALLGAIYQEAGLDAARAVNAGALAQGCTEPKRIPEVIHAARVEAEQALAGRGRLVLRASGTEPVIRVTVEADDPALVQRVAQAVAAAVSSAT